MEITVGTPAAEPAADWKVLSLPLRPENRMSTLLIAAVLILCGIAVWGVKVIASAPNQQSTPAYAFLGVSIAIALKILLAMLQTEFARRDLRAGQQAITDNQQVISEKMDEVVERTNGGLTRAVHEATEQVRSAERDQVVNDPEFRKALAEDLCPLLAGEVAKQLMAEMRKERKPPA